jgi:hypothetical protein
MKVINPEATSSFNITPVLKQSTMKGLEEYLECKKFATL